MPIDFKKTVAVCSDECTIEDAETLLEWLLDNPKGKINLKQCELLHTAVIQVLMAVRPSISAQPEQLALSETLQACSLLEQY